MGTAGLSCSPATRPPLALHEGAMMRNPTNETYVPLSRGLKDHLPGMAKGYRLNLYIYLLIEARHSGPNRGKVAVSFSDLALFFDVHYQTIVKAARGLKEDGYITYQPAKSPERRISLLSADCSENVQ